MKRIATLSLTLFVAAACTETPTMPSAGVESPEASFSRAGTVDVIVALDPSFAGSSHAASVDRAAGIARELGVTPTHAYGTALFGFAATIPEGRLAALAQDPRVAYVDLDGVVSIPERIAARPGSGGSTGEVTPWGINRTGADASTNEGAGIHVYIIDTGIDSDHPDLTGRLGNGFAAETCKGGGCNYAWDDDHDHGTHVAGTVGANDNEIDVIGMATGVTLHAVKVLSRAGSGTRSGVIAGVDWVANETKALGQATVANMSLGGSGSKTGSCSSTGFSGTDTYHQALCNATRAGVVFAVAAGNDGADAQGAVPAAYDDAVITVSATTCSLSGQVCKSGSDNWTSWSNWGDNTATFETGSVTHAPVAIAAPGASVLSLKRGGGTTSFSGTSMASPHAAGAAAMYLASSSQAAAYSAFSNTRQALMTNAVAVANNTTGNPHGESLLQVK